MFSGRKNWMIGSALFAAAATALGAATDASAALVELHDANSVVRFDTAGSGGYDWVIDSVDVLAQQWFWYRIGSGPATAINLISAATTATADTAPNPGDNLLQLVYENSQLKVTLFYSLAGGSADSGVSSMTQLVTIKAKQNLPGALQFFQYADFNLSPNDTLRIANGNTAMQAGEYGSIQQTAATPAPTTYQADTGGDLLSMLAGGSPSLDNDPHTVSGEVNWLFAWNLGALAAGRQELLSIPQTVHLSSSVINVPEPASVAMLTLGIVLIRWGGRNSRGRGQRQFAGM